MGVWRLTLLAAAIVLAACNDNRLGGSDSPDLHVSVPDLGGGCGLRTCASAHAACGPIGDGCGKLLNCGVCTPPQSCGGGGTHFTCGGTMGCVPRTCFSIGANCGPAADGCGSLIQCGTCPDGQSCGAGGQANVCAPKTGSGSCVPRNCQQQGFNCGPAGDGCGGMLNCGGCQAGLICGGSGKAGVCGITGACTTRTCAQDGYNCGLAGDGCGGVMDCGGCAYPDGCGGAGLPNVCGHVDVTDGGPPCTGLCLQQVQCDGGTTTISGTVLAPTNPTLGFGQPDPIYSALVYVPNGPVAAFTPGVSCDKCGAQASGAPLVSALTSTDGRFVLQNAPCGTNIPLVIQVGRWRRQITIPIVSCCLDTALTAEQTHLPRNHTEGDIPLIAVVTGSADPIECVLPKIGIDQSEFSLPSGSGRVRFYVANGANFGTGTPAAGALFGSPAELAKYDAVIADCESTPIAKQPAQQQNVIDYTTKGGRFFASHYSYTWLYNITPFYTTATWDADQPQLPDLTAYIDTTFNKGAAFATWLQGVKASTTLGRIPVQQVRHDADAVLNPPSQRWMYADPAYATNAPLEFTFNTPIGAAPANQCGRVLFSDFHVNTGGLGFGTFPVSCNGPAPLTPQERVLEFLLFDLTSCIQADGSTSTSCTPRTCAQQGFGCGPAGDGCGNIIQCGTCPGATYCGGGGPNQCGLGQCVPLSCRQQGFNCGAAGDGCGGGMNCGECPAGLSCGGGTPGVCGVGLCAPRSCAQQSLGCGPAGDGCGNQISCGSCPEGQICGGGGTPGVCGKSKCAPLSCQAAGANCGPIGDGCGGVIDCGTCPGGQTCGGTGIANVCGGLG